MTLWDDHYFNQEKLENWLYGKDSLEGQTRKWFVSEAKKWPPGIEFLDAGCGGGVTAYQLAQAKVLDKIKYTGVDFSKCMLDLAQKMVKHPNAKWICSPLEIFSSTEEFDRVLLRAVLEHNFDPEPVLKNMLAALKKTGMLYIVFWNNPSLGESIVAKTPEGFYDIAHSRRKLEKIVELEGFHVRFYHSVQENSARSSWRDAWMITR